MEINPREKELIYSASRMIAFQAYEIAMLLAVEEKLCVSSLFTY
jgi:hypothetical protein